MTVSMLHDMAKLAIDALMSVLAAQSFFGGRLFVGGSHVSMCVVIVSPTDSSWH